MITVYGKHGCGYCVKAKNLLESKNIPYQYITIGEDIGVTEFVEMYPNVKSAPFILNKNNVIGGYDNLQKYIEETSSGFADSII
jgi:glutaredoxin 1